MGHFEISDYESDKLSDETKLKTACSFLKTILK